MKRILIFMSLLVIGVGASAGNDALIKQVLDNNQGLKNSELSMKGDILSQRTENNLADPEAEVEFYPAGETEVTVSETFEWPTAYITRSKAIKKRISALEYLYEAKKVEVARDAMLLYVEIVNINRQIARKQQLLGVSDSILSKISATDLRSDFTVLDRTRLRLSAFDAKAEIGQLRVKRTVLCEELTRLNGGKALTGVDLQSTDFAATLLPIDDYLTAYDNSADVKASLARAEALNYDVKTAVAGNLPNIKLGYKFMSEGFHGGVVGISIPIFANRGKVKAAKAQLAAQSAATDYAQHYGRSTVRIQYANVADLASQIDEYKKIINADEVVSYLNTSLAKHSITMVDYLAEYQYLISALSKLDDMRYDYDTKYVELSKYLLVEMK